MSVYAHLPEIFSHVVQATDTLWPIVKPHLNQILENGKDITSAFGQNSPLTPTQKIQHGIKLASFTGLFVAATASFNIEGSIPSAYVVSDECKKLGRLGHKIRSMHSQDQFQLF